MRRLRASRPDPNPNDTHHLVGLDRRFLFRSGTVHIVCGIEASVCCGSPSLADGAWFLVYHESGNHFKYEPVEPKPILSGVLHARFSTDGGRTWSKEDHCHDGTPVAGFPAFPPGAEPTSGRFEPGEPWTYLAPNGDLVVHSLKDNFNARRWQGTWQMRSHDGGRTWSEFEKIDFEDIENE